MNIEQGCPLLWLVHKTRRATLEIEEHIAYIHVTELVLLQIKVVRIDPKRSCRLLLVALLIRRQGFLSTPFAGYDGGC
jgi:hypothetical protein